MCKLKEFFQEEENYGLHEEVLSAKQNELQRGVASGFQKDEMLYASTKSFMRRMKSGSANERSWFKENIITYLNKERPLSLDDGESD